MTDTTPERSEPAGHAGAQRDTSSLSACLSALRLAGDVADAIRRLQGDDPLAEVVIVTPRGPTAQTLRRLLPRTVSVDGVQQGVIGARFETPVDLARSIVDAADGAQPAVSPLMLTAAVQRELLDNCPPILGAVAASPSTVEAIVEISERVRLLPADDSVSFAGASPGRSALLDVALRARRRLRRHYPDEHTTLTRALELLAEASRGDAVARSGLPDRLVMVVTDCIHPGQVPFVATLIEAVPSVEIVTMAVELEDQDLRQQIAVFGGAVTDYGPPPRPRLVSCPDQDEEVRTAVRSVASVLRARAQAATAGESSASSPSIIVDDLVIAYPGGTGYQRAITDELDRARIPWVGTAPQLIRESVVGTVLRLALAAIADPSRDNVIALAAAAPFHSNDDEPIRKPAYWKRLATQTDISASEDWERLPAEIERQRARLAPANDEAGRADNERDDRRRAAIESDIAELEALNGFVDVLTDAKAALIGAASWSAASDALAAYVRHLIGPTDQGAWLLSAPWQVGAVDQVNRGIDALAILDGQDPDRVDSNGAHLPGDLAVPYSREAMQQLVDQLLEQPVRQTGMNGTGVRVRPITDGTCSDGDVVFILGANDGLLPPNRTEQMFQPHPDDTEADYIEHCYWHQARVRRAWQRLLHSGAEVTVSWARADMRKGGELFPSPLLGQFGDGNVHDLVEDVHINSHVEQLHHGEPLSRAELLARLPDPAHGDEIAGRSVEALQSRQLPYPTRFDGQVDGQLGDNPEFAPTQLEHLATCGITYLYRYCLGAYSDYEVPAGQAISPAERGNLVHNTLEQVVRAWLADPSQGDWMSDKHLGIDLSGIADQSARDSTIRDALRSLAEPHFASYEEDLEREGAIRDRALWAIERGIHFNGIVNALVEERTERATPLAAEHRFGRGEDRPFSFETSRGPVGFRGSIDRVDLVGDNTRVTDYKSTNGEPDSFPSDGTDGGKKLQLPLYALVAEQHFNAPPTEPRYLYLRGETVKPVGPNVGKGMNIDELLSRFGEAVDTLVGRIGSGDLRPGEPNSRWGCNECAPDSLGISDVTNRVLSFANDDAHNSINDDNADGDADGAAGEEPAVAPDIIPDINPDIIVDGWLAVPSDPEATAPLGGSEVADEAERHRATTQLGKDLVVVAGAGSGKTTVLVERVANELASNPSLASGLVMITYTEKAARELRDRLRSRVPDAPVDEAYIGTIHGFCSSILRRFPIEAGLPPRFETVGELGAAAEAQQRARAQVSHLFRLATGVDEDGKTNESDSAAGRRGHHDHDGHDDRDGHEPAVDRGALHEALTYLVREGRTKDLTQLALLVDQQWITFENSDIPQPRSIDEMHAAIAERTRPIRDLYESAPARFANDKFVTRLREMVEVLDDLPYSFDQLSRIDVGSVDRGGSAAVWEGTEFATVKEAKDSIKPIVGRFAANAVCADEALRRVLAALVPIVLTEARSRVTSGLVTYDDLLVLTQRLLATHPEVLNELRGTYDQIYVDEFQDTDRVQFDIVSDLTGRRRDDGATAPDTSNAPATLFVVGDPKQAIYAFRGADPSLLNREVAKARNDSANPGGVVDLTMNFRSRAGICRWINQVVGARFGDPRVGDPEVEDGERLGSTTDEHSRADARGQAPYEDLVSNRADVPGDPGPAVSLIGFDGPDAPTPTEATNADEARQAEAADLSIAIQRAIGIETSTSASAPWLVRGDDDEFRPARFGDIAILIRARSNLGNIEHALRLAEIPYRVEGGILLYDSREVYELLRVLRAVNNLDDIHAVVTALRTSVLGIGDDQLVAFYNTFRYWRVPSPERLADAEASGSLTDEMRAVVEALASLRRWAELRGRLNPAQLLASLYDSTFGAAAAIGAEGSAARETLRRVRFAVDEARAWVDETGGTLTEYLDWVDERVAETDRTELSTNEVDNAVRIMTIHSSKGLQFPIVMVAGLGAQDSHRGDVKTEAVDGQIAVKFTKQVCTQNFPQRDAAAEHDEEARLVYVAFTRAEDHLVVSGHHSSSSTAIGRLAPALIEVPTPIIVSAATDDPDADDPDADDPGADQNDAIASTEAGIDAGIDRDEPAVSDRPVHFVPLAPHPRRTVWTPSSLAAALAETNSPPAHPADHPQEHSGPVPAAADGGVEWATYARDTLDPGLRKDPVLGIVQERSKGRYGTAVGTAVHEVLQFVDLSDPTTHLDQLAQTAADNADVPDAAAQVASLASSIINTDLFAEMCASPTVEREIYVGTELVGTGLGNTDGDDDDGSDDDGSDDDGSDDDGTVDDGSDDDGSDDDGTVVWGYIDAVFERPEGLVVVDFKTDAIQGDGTALQARYGPQLSAYAAAVARTSGRPVDAAYLLVAGRDNNPGEAIKIDVLLTEDQLIPR